MSHEHESSVTPTVDVMEHHAPGLAHGGVAAGHELDTPPNRRLFNLLVGLSIAIMGACIALVQMFNRQAETIEEGRFDTQVVLGEHRKQMEQLATSYGPADNADKGKVYHRMPLAKAKELVLEDPTKLEAAPPPAGWIHPDDVAGGGTK